MSNLCEIVRKDAEADRMFCLYPHREANGLVQACTIAYNEAITINLKFFDKYGIQVWLDMDSLSVHFYPGKIIHDCFHIHDFALFLYQQHRQQFSSY
jgi:hypothetical protein